MKLTVKGVVAVLGIVILIASGGTAAEISHYAQSAPLIRDIFLPAPGFHVMDYNVYYKSTQFKDRNGDEVDSIVVGLAKINVEADVDIYVNAPSFMWVTEFKAIKGKYSAYITPSFGNTSVSASLSTQTGRGIDAETSQFAFGDLFIQPVWLGWTLPHADLSIGYGIYLPTGKYDAGAADNVGLGFTTHQFQAAAAWYPWVHQGTAVVAAAVYEINGDKEDADITPGSHFTLNWGISQFLPLKKDESLLLEIGPTGYHQWQTSDDEGADVAGDPSIHDEIHAIGAELGFVPVKTGFGIFFRWLHEFSAVNRFEGDFFNVTLYKEI